MENTTPQSGSKPLVPIIVVASVVLVLIGVVLMIMGSQQSPAAQTGPQPSVVVTPQAMNVTTEPLIGFSRAGSNGHLGFRLSHPARWALNDLSSNHQAVWVQLDYGRAHIIINQAPKAGERCSYPGDTVPTEGPTGDGIERLGHYDEVRIASGQVFRVAAQTDYAPTSYACQENKAADRYHDGTLTSIGEITLDNPAQDPAVTRDFLEILKTIEISAQ